MQSEGGRFRGCGILRGVGAGESRAGAQCGQSLGVGHGALEREVPRDREPQFVRVGRRKSGFAADF